MVLLELVARGVLLVLLLPRASSLARSASQASSRFWSSRLASPWTRRGQSWASVLHTGAPSAFNRFRMSSTLLPPESPPSPSGCPNCRELCQAAARSRASRSSRIPRVSSALGAAGASGAAGGRSGSSSMPISLSTGAASTCGFGSSASGMIQSLVF